MPRSIDLSPSEWESLAQLSDGSADKIIPIEHKAKLIRLGVAAEKRGATVPTFEGRLALRERRL